MSDFRERDFGGGLSVEEDEELRRLHLFEEIGCDLSLEQRITMASYRVRDRRRDVRIPRQAVVPVTEPDSASTTPSAALEA